jgi:hypothetical protein
MRSFRASVRVSLGLACLGTLISLSRPAHATPIRLDSDVERSVSGIQLGVNPSKTSGAERYRWDAAGLALPDFYRGMDLSSLPAEFYVRGNGVVLFRDGRHETGGVGPGGSPGGNPAAETPPLVDLPVPPGIAPIPSLGETAGSAGNAAADIPTVVNPEPGTIILLGTGLLLAARARRRRRE